MTQDCREITVSDRIGCSGRRWIHFIAWRGGVTLLEGGGTVPGMRSIRSSQNQRTLAVRSRLTLEPDAEILSFVTDELEDRIGSCGWSAFESPGSPDREAWRLELSRHPHLWKWIRLADREAD